MIIHCGNRRLKSYAHGWMIQKKYVATKGKKKGRPEWREESPAYPATLAQGLEMIAERIFLEGDDLTPQEMPEALRKAAHAVREYMRIAREAA